MLAFTLTEPQPSTHSTATATGDIVFFTVATSRDLGRDAAKVCYSWKAQRSFCLLQISDCSSTTTTTCTTNSAQPQLTFPNIKLLQRPSAQRGVDRPVGNYWALCTMEQMYKSIRDYCKPSLFWSSYKTIILLIIRNSYKRNTHIRDYFKPS